MLSHRCPKRPSTAWLLPTITGLCSFAVATAQTLYVDDDASLGGNGQSWNAAFRYLQDALYAAAGDPSVQEIRVAQGTYKPDQDEGGHVTPGDRDAAFQLLGGIPLAGGYAGVTEADPDARDIELYETILSGDLAANDGPDFENYDENSRHVVIAAGADDADFLDGCTIVAGNADGAYPHYRGGGVYCMAPALFISLCTFSRNRAEDAGGGVYCDGAGELTVWSCAFTENAAGESGGGLLGSDTLIGCVFTGNTADVDGGGASAGVAVIDCVFRDNSAGRAGGALNGGGTIENCAFEGNSAGVRGGAANSQGVFSECSFSNNLALWNGGAACCHGTPVFVDCTFTDNRALDNGGAIYLDSGGLELVRCTLSDNIAGDSGGAVCDNYSGSNAVAFTECLFSGNEAHDLGGGAFFGHDSEALVTNSTFLENLAYSGAGVYFDRHSVADIGETTFRENDADWGGGGIYCDDGTSTLTRCTFRENYAGYGGGAGIHNAAGSLDLLDCILLGNQTVWNGGGLYNLAGSANLTNCRVIANVNWGAGNGTAGGGACNENGELTATNTTFSGNASYGHVGDSLGAGIGNKSGTVSLVSCLFCAGDVETGYGAGLGSEYGINSLANCLFVGNIYGPTLSFYESEESTITNCTIVPNSWTGVWGGYANLHLANCILWRCWRDAIDATYVDVEYSCVEGGWEGQGNIDVDPQFQHVESGTWTANAIYDPETFVYTLTDDNAAWTANELVGKFVFPRVDGSPWPGNLIIANTSTTITVWSDGRTIVRGPYVSFEGRTYEIHDLRLAPGSPCIDAANNDAVPTDALDLDDDGDTQEQLPFDFYGNPRFIDDPLTDDTGVGTPPIVDMGACEFPACPGDLDADKVVDQADLGILLADWGCVGSACAGDVDADGDTDQADLGTLLEFWGASCP